MEKDHYSADSIKLSPETEEGGRLYRQAIAYAKTGEFEKALLSANAIMGHAFRLNRFFTDEALACIAFHCAKLEKEILAISIAETIESHRFRDEALGDIALICVERNDFATASSLLPRIGSKEIKNLVSTELNGQS